MVTMKSPVFTGIYGIPEAATYLSNTPPLINGHRVNPAKLRYWIRTSVPHVAPSIFPTRQRLITFLDLVSMRMIMVMRSRNIKLREIREAEDFLRKEFGLEFPFASKPLWTYGSHIYIKYEEYLLSVSKYGQQAMDFIRKWLTKVEIDMTFDECDLASSWLLHRGIRIDPKIQFGESCIDGTRVPTSAILNTVKAGDPIEVVAKSFGLSLEQVQNALQWEHRIATPT